MTQPASSPPAYRGSSGGVSYCEAGAERDSERSGAGNQVRWSTGDSRERLPAAERDDGGGESDVGRGANCRRTLLKLGINCRDGQCGGGTCRSVRSDGTQAWSTFRSDHARSFLPAISSSFGPPRSASSKSSIAFGHRDVLKGCSDANA